MDTVRKHIMKTGVGVSIIRILTTSTSSSWSLDRNVNSVNVLNWFAEGGGITPQAKTGTSPAFNLSANTGTVEILIVSEFGFENFTTIGSLYDRKITYMDLSQHPTLWEIYFDGANMNTLTSLDLSSNVNLDTIRLEGTSLTSLDVSMIPTLRVLTLSDCDFSGGIDISNNPALDYLYMNNCNLSYIDLSTGSSLIDLRLNNNNLSGVYDISHFSGSIAKIDFSYNPGITDIFIPYLYYLTSISVNNCSLTVDGVNRIIASNKLSKQTGGVLNYSNQLSGAEPTGNSSFGWGGDVMSTWSYLRSRSWTVTGMTPTYVKNQMPVTDVYFGNMGSMIKSKAQLAYDLSIAESDIIDFFVDSGMNIFLRTDANLTLRTTWKVPMRSIIDLTGKVVNITASFAFVKSYNLIMHYFPKSLFNGGGGFNNRGWRQSAFRELYLPMVVVFGNNTEDNQTFLSATGGSGCTLYCNRLFETANNGAVEPDVAHLILRGANIQYLDEGYNDHKPGPVTDLTVTNVTEDSCVINFTPPASVNPIKKYEYWRNGAFIGWALPGDTISLYYRVIDQTMMIVAMDDLGNRSDVGNTITGINTKI